MTCSDFPYVTATTVTDAQGLSVTNTSTFTVLNSVSIQPPAFTNLAGSTDGALTVSPTGAAIYTVSLSVPPGTAGVAPNLSLNYSSQGRDGLLGFGWSLGGLSMITRCPRTLAQDGVAGKVDFNVNYPSTQTKDDRFCLDGQRLVLAAGSYGLNASEYRTEIDIISKIVGYATFEPFWTGINYFKVYTKSGLILTYGPDDPYDVMYGPNAAVRQVFNGQCQYSGDTGIAWALWRVEDRHGNYMRVLYAKDTLAGDCITTGPGYEVNHRPVEISYTGNASITPSQAPYNRIVFEYENGRPDPIRTFLSGVKTDNDKRLAKVTTYVNNDAQVGRQYRLSYQTSQNSGRSLLTSIQECDGTDPNLAACLPQTTFGWTQRSVDNQFRQNAWGGPLPDFTGIPSPTLRDLRAKVLLGDFNGDGRLDLATSDGSTWNVCLSTGSQFSCSSWAGGPAVKSDKVLLGDFNGDGKTDIAVPPPASGAWQICLAQATSTFSCSNWTAAATGLPIANYVVSDFNGDGRDDIGSKSPDYLCVTNSTVTGFNCSVYGGFYDALSNTRQQPDDPLERQDAVLGDLNGDGRTDIVALYVQPVAPINPTGFVAGNSQLEQSVWATALGSSANLGLTWSLGGNAMGDINGDGYNDLVINFNTGSPSYLSSTKSCRSDGKKWSCPVRC